MSVLHVPTTTPIHFSVHSAGDRDINKDILMPQYNIGMIMGSRQQRIDLHRRHCPKRCPMQHSNFTILIKLTLLCNGVSIADHTLSRHCSFYPIPPLIYNKTTASHPEAAKEDICNQICMHGGHTKSQRKERGERGGQGYTYSFAVRSSFVSCHKNFVTRRGSWNN